MTRADRIVFVAMVALVISVAIGANTILIPALERALPTRTPAPRTTLIPPVTTTPFGYLPESSWSGSDLNPTNGSQR